MFVLKKLFQAREKMAQRRSRWDDVEKPFLDHLEDLRKMLMKSAITLTVAMVVCFLFNQELLNLVRLPVKLAGLDSIDGCSLPEQQIKRDDWGRIKEFAKGAASLAGAEREAFLHQVPTEHREAVRAAIIFRAAMALPKEKREGFVTEALPDGPARGMAVFLVKENADVNLDKTVELLRMTALSPPETFALTMKLAFFAGIVVSFPLLFWFIAEFIVPGLTRKERKLIAPSVGIGFGLFLVGVVFAFLVVIPRALQFFHEYSLGHDVSDEWRIGQYVSFVTQVTLIFGLCFELPVVVMALVKLGILSYSTMSGTRSYGIVAIFVVAAVITPTTDALTLMLLAGPMIVLYEFSIWMAYFIERKARKREEEEEREWRERRLQPALEAESTVVEEKSATPALEAGAEPESDPDPEPQPAPGAVPQSDSDLPHDWGHEKDPYEDPYNLDPWNEPADEAAASGDPPAKSGAEEDAKKEGEGPDESPEGPGSSAPREDQPNPDPGPQGEGGEKIS